MALHVDGIESPVQQPSYTLRVLHTNDHHGQVQPIMLDGRPTGSVARRKTCIDRLRAQGSFSLLLDAGDLFLPPAVAPQYDSQADLYFYNTMGYDALVVGNHDFDRGVQLLADFIDRTQFPVLSANLVVHGRSPLAGKIKPYVIRNVGGEQIGIVGLTTEDTNFLSDPGPDVTFTSHSVAACRAVADLTLRGITKIIALTHLGFETDRALARSVAGISLIVGGHSHTELGDHPDAPGQYPTIESGPDGAAVLIVQSGGRGQYLGDISLDFDADSRVVGWSGGTILIDASIPPDPVFEARIAG